MYVPTSDYNIIEIKKKKKILKKIKKIERAGNNQEVI